MAEAKAPKTTKKTAVAPAQDDAFKVQVRKGPLASETPAEAPEEKEDLKVHHELVLEAPKELETEEAPETDSDASSWADKLASDAEPETKEEPPAPDKSAEETAKEVPAKEEASADSETKSDAPLGSPSEGPDKDLQSPTVFDTKQYHLPINEAHAGGSHKVLWVFLFLLIAAAGVLAAIDAGYLDFGFELPFDLIKN